MSLRRYGGPGRACFPDRAALLGGRERAEITDLASPAPGCITSRMGTGVWRGSCLTQFCWMRSTLARYAPLRGVWGPGYPKCSGMLRSATYPAGMIWRTRGIERRSPSCVHSLLLEVCIDQVTFMQQLVQPDRLRARIGSNNTQRLRDCLETPRPFWRRCSIAVSCHAATSRRWLP